LILLIEMRVSALLNLRFPRRMKINSSKMIQTHAGENARVKPRYHVQSGESLCANPRARQADLEITQTNGRRLTRFRWQAADR
jgi:hypothetical protein